MSLAGLLGIVIIFGAIVLFHEFGHFIVAKLSRMTVHEFSMGFGPALWSRTLRGTQYAIRAVPLGGYVRIAGMELEELGEDENGKPKPEPPGSFNTKPFPAKFMTILAGALMNMVLAFIIFLVMGMAIGYPQPGKHVVITEVMMNSPAEKAGIRAGDRVMQVGAQRDPTPEQMKNIVQTAPPPIPITLLRNGETIRVAITPKTLDTAKPDGMLLKADTYKGIGVVMEPLSGAWKRVGLGTSCTLGVLSVYDSLRLGVMNILSLFSGHVPWRMVSGPVGVMTASYKQTEHVASSRLALFNAFNFAALISVLIGLFNLLPIPALDGSRLVFLIIEAVRGKPINKEKEAMVHLVGMILLLSFVALISIKDVIVSFGGKIGGH